MATTHFTGPVQSTYGFKGSTGLTLTNVLGASATLDFGSISAAAQEDLTITVTGAAANNTVVLGLPAAPAAGIVFNAFVSAANTVTVRATNASGSPVNPGSATYSVVVLQVA